MIDSVMLRATARILVPILAVFSVFLLLRGHNEPGGGFIGGLVLGLALLLALLSFERYRVVRAVPSPFLILGVGLLVSLGSALVAPLVGAPVFEGVWGGSFYFPTVGDIKVGTVLFFDVGVYIVVFGTVAKIVFSLVEEE
jgi:multicomponent Na+:H+ antiporter subunit B